MKKTYKNAAKTTAVLSSGPVAAGITYTTVATYGTASTGTAISTLSGVAAHNATMAALGGGSLAAGGGGMAMGALALTGVGVLVIISGFGIWAACSHYSKN